VADVTEDAGLAPLLPIIRAERISGMAFIPLEGTEGVIGKFMLYYAEPHSLSPVELQLAVLIAAQVAFAVARTRAHLAERASEERRICPDASTRTDRPLAATQSPGCDSEQGPQRHHRVVGCRRNGCSATREPRPSASRSCLSSRPNASTKKHSCSNDLCGVAVQMETGGGIDGRDVRFRHRLSNEECARTDRRCRKSRDITARKQHEAERTELYLPFAAGPGVGDALSLKLTPCAQPRVNRAPTWWPTAGRPGPTTNRPAGGFEV
jgi:hypothetical protein